MHMVLAIHSLVLSITSLLGANTDIAGQVKNQLAGPVLTAAEFLIPAAVAISAIHKLMEHRESGGALLVELIIKGGGAIVVCQIVKAMAGL